MTQTQHNNMHTTGGFSSNLNERYLQKKVTLDSFKVRKCTTQFQHLRGNSQPPLEETSISRLKKMKSRTKSRNLEIYSKKKSLIK